MWVQCIRGLQQEVLAKRSVLFLKPSILSCVQSKNFSRSANHLTAMNNEKFQLSTKYHGLEKNVWVEFVKIALEYKPLNLGQGLPDDLVPDYVIKALHEVLADENAALQQYTRGFGHPRLINAIAALYTQFLNRQTQIGKGQSKASVSIEKSKLFRTTLTRSKALNS